MSMMTTSKTGQRTMSLPMDHWQRQCLSWLLLLSSILLTTVSANGNNNNYHSNLLASSSSPSTSSSSSTSSTSSSSSNPGSYYSFPLNIVEAAKLYQSRSSGYSSPAIVNFLQQYQPQPHQQHHQESLASAARRSQQDAASLYNQPETINLSPAMQQLASSLLAASAQSVASFEQPPAAAPVDNQQNYSAGLLDAGNAALAESAFYNSPNLYNYFLGTQQFYPSDPSSAYALSPAALEMYTAAFLQGGNGSTVGGKHSSAGVSSQNNKATGANKQGLGRRIGELVSNSAERASRAFKSFSQFKLFNDIKPSRLLGLVSDQQQQQQQSGDGKSLVNSSAASMVASASAPSSAWYFPPSSQVAAGIPVANPWSPAAYGAAGGGQASAASPSFYQQPVYVRTQDVNGGQAAAAAALAAQKGADYLASMSEFYPQKLSSLDGTGAAPFAPSPPNANIALSGSTTVYHHYGPSSMNGGRGGGGNEGGSSQNSDLFAAPQTQFGVRMKPPKDFDFDASNEDELSNSSSEQDDAKMADNGGGGSNGGRNNLDNGVGDGSSSGGDRFNERPSNGGGGSGSGNGGGNGPWSSGSSSFDEYSEPNSGVEPDLYNAYNPNVPNNGQRFRPFNTGHSGFRPVAPNAFQASVPNLRPYMAGIRRPNPLSSAAEFDDTDSWYNTFFGNNIKPMTRLRGVPFANNAPMAAAAAFANSQVQFPSQTAAHHHQPHPSLLNSAASTQTPTSLSPDNYFGNAHHHAHHHAPHPNYFQAAYNRPVWPGYSTAMYPGAASPYFRANPLLAGAATQMRPVTLPYNPYFMAPRYPQAPRPAMFGHAAYPTASPMMMAAAARYPTAMSPYSIMPSASTLYPVRVPFTPMMPMANPFAAMAASSLIPTIAQPPIMRYRIGTDLTPKPVASSSSSPAVTPIRRTLNITKRGQLGGSGSASNGLDLVDTASSVLSKVGKAIANTLPSVKLGSLSLSGGAAAKNEEAAEIIVPNEQEASLATLYNAYQVLQRRMETNEHSQASPSSSPENVSSRTTGQQQQQSAQPPPPYYHYYIGDKDTYQSTSTSTTTSTSTSSPLSTVLNSFQENGGLGFSTEHLDSSARAIPLNFTASSSSSTGVRSIKARHVGEQLAEHEKRQQEIRQFLDEAEVGVRLAENGTVPSPTYIIPSSTTTTTTSSPTVIRTAKAVSTGSSSLPQIFSAGDSSPWRPLLRSAVVGRKRY